MLQKSDYPVFILNVGKYIIVASQFTLIFLGLICTVPGVTKCTIESFLKLTIIIIDSLLFCSKFNAR